MQVVASQPSSVVEVSLEPGDELVTSLKRALAEAGLTDAFILGAGEIEDAEVLTLTAAGKREHRKLSGPSDLVALSGAFGEQGLELRATLAQENGSGSSTLGGLLVKATVVSVQARALVRGLATNDKPGAPTRVVEAAPREPSPPVAPVVHITPPPLEEPKAAPPIESPPERPEALAPPRELGARSVPQGGPPLPPKLRRADTIEIYPEEGDVVTHFAFGRCVVVFSDGERLRLQQDRDGRVREVALSMLRIEPPTLLENGKREWELARKN